MAERTNIGLTASEMIDLFNQITKRTEEDLGAAREQSAHGESPRLAELTNEFKESQSATVSRDMLVMVVSALVDLIEINNRKLSTDVLRLIDEALG